MPPVLSEGKDNRVRRLGLWAGAAGSALAAFYLLAGTGHPQGSMQGAGAQSVPAAESPHKSPVTQAAQPTPTPAARRHHRRRKLPKIPPVPPPSLP